MTLAPPGPPRHAPALRPQWLEVKDTDDEKTVARKRKLLKSYKSKIRFANKDMVQKQKQDNWQSFLKGKATKKKPGFLTGALHGAAVGGGGRRRGGEGRGQAPRAAPSWIAVWSTAL